MREDAALSHRNACPFRALGLTPPTSARPLSSSQHSSANPPIHSVFLALSIGGAHSSFRPHPGLTRLALLSAETPVTGLVPHQPTHTQWVMMNGKPEVSNATLRRMIRTRHAAGSLLPVDGKVFAGKGTGQLCTVCGMPIFATEIENKVANPRTAYAHSTCHSMWLEESTALRESRQ